jgi:hypothetical protein
MDVGEMRAGLREVLIAVSRDLAPMRFQTIHITTSSG